MSASRDAIGAIRSAATWLVLAVPMTMLLYPTVATSFTTAGREALVSVATHQHRVVGSTLVLAVTVGLLGTAVGTLMAAMHHSYRFRGRAALHVMAIAPVLLPPVAASTTLLQIWGNNGLLTRLTGRSWVSVYGFAGLVVADTLAMVPVAYLVVLAGFRDLDEGLVDQARDIGASAWRVARDIMVPRLRPQITAVFLLLVANTAVDVANPLALGGGYPVLATRLREAAIGEGDMPAAGATALVMLLICGVAVLAMPAAPSSHFRRRAIQERTMRTRRRPPSSPWERTALWLAWLVAGANAVSLPVVVLGSVTGTGTGPGWTLSRYREVLSGQNSLVLADSVVAAGCSALLALVLSIALLAAGGSDGGRSMPRILLVSSAPALPLALGALALWRVPGWGAAQVTTILALVVAVQTLVLVPGLVAFLKERMATLTPSVTESAASLGVPARRMLAPLVIPHLRPALIGAMVLGFATGMTSVPSVILLTGSDAPFMAAQIVTDVEAGRLGTACAMSTLTAVTVALVGLGIWLVTGGLRRD